MLYVIIYNMLKMKWHSVNKELEQYIKRRVREFEAEHGPIAVEQNE